MNRRRKLLILTVGTLALAWFWRGLLLPAVATFLDISEPAQCVDCVLVLNGGPETRPFVAAVMVNAGLADKVLLTTASPTVDTEDSILRPEHEIVSEVLRARGVAQDRIQVIPGEIANTYDEALALARFLKLHPVDSVAIVTNDFHMRRTRRVFRRVLGENGPELSFVAAPVDNINPDNWWESDDGVKIYATEYCKLIYYIFQY